MDTDIELENDILSYDDFRESQDINKHSSQIPLYVCLIVMVVIMVIMIAASFIVCFTDDTCKNRIPTTTNLLNSTFTAPFLVTAINAALISHGIIVIGVYFRTHYRAPQWSILQVILSIFAYASVCISLFISGKTGWNHDWGNLATLLIFIGWMICVQFAFKAVYKDRITREKKLLRISLCILVLYILVVIIYVVLRSVPIDKYVNEKSKQVGLLVSEILTAITLLGYTILTVIHTRRVRFSLLYKQIK